MSVPVVSDLQVRLAAYRSLVTPLLVEALPTKEPRRYLYDLIQAHLSRPGKGIRPAFCIATAQAFGGDAADAVPSAAALELLHNAFLVHDDIEDESEFRRDQPTMQSQHGVPLAINTGDAMQALSIRLLGRNLPRLGPQTTWQIVQEFDHMLLESLEGQALELGWIRDNKCDVTAEDYLLMSLKKTCWYSFIHPCRIGALVAGRPARELDRFNRFGYLVGAAFQLQDDVLNLVGNSRTYGKEIGGDLWEGKRTLMVAHLFGKVNGAEAEKLRALFAKTRRQRMQREIDWLLQLMHSRGSIEYARTAAGELAAAAIDAFDVAFGDAPVSEHKAFLRELVSYMIERRV